MNTRDEPIEIDMDESSASTSTSTPTPSVLIPEPHQRPQEVRPQEPEQQLARSSTSGSAAPSSSTAPDLHTLLGLNTGVLPQSSQSSAVSIIFHMITILPNKRVRHSCTHRMRLSTSTWSIRPIAPRQVLLYPKSEGQKRRSRLLRASP